MLKQAELGRPVEEAPGRWASAMQGSTNVLTQEEVRGLGPSESRQLRQLEEGNSKLKRVVANLNLDNGSAPNVQIGALHSEIHLLRFVNQASYRNVIGAFFPS